jgi:hypothetical protein
MADPPEPDLARMFPARRKPENGRGTAEPRCDDLQAYQRLLNLAEELQRLSDRCWSVASQNSLRIAAAVTRRIASKVYRRGLRKRE